jgi:hypothetical protein
METEYSSETLRVLQSDCTASRFKDDRNFHNSLRQNPQQQNTRKYFNAHFVKYFRQNLNFFDENLFLGLVSLG